MKTFKVLASCLLLYLLLFGILPVVVPLIASIPLYSSKHGKVMDADTRQGLQGVYVFGFDDCEDPTIDKTASFLSMATTNEKGEFELPSQWSVMWRVHDPKEAFLNGMLGWLMFLQPMGHTPTGGEERPRFVLRAFSPDYVAVVDEKAIDSAAQSKAPALESLSRSHPSPILLKRRNLSLQEAASYYSKILNRPNPHTSANPARKVAFERLSTTVCELPAAAEVDAKTFWNLTWNAVAKDPFDLQVAREQAYKAMAKLEPENMDRRTDAIYRAGDVCVAVRASETRPEPRQLQFY